MRDRIFLDTNLLVYSSLQNDTHKHDKALQFLETIKGKIVFISTQVVNEVYFSLLKHKLNDQEIERITEKIIDIYNVSVIYISTIKKAWSLRKQFNFSYWDSLIVASALEANCEVLYTEDMQDGLTINSTLTIRNPFG